MLLLPYENLTLTTELTADEARERLSEVIDSPKMFRAYWIFAPPPPKPYQGTIAGNKFRIRRIINYRNGFLTVIEGNICPDLMGCHIAIKIKLNSIVILFLLLWVGICLPTGLMSLLEIFKYKTIAPSKCLVQVVMGIVGYVICMIAFKIQARIAKKFLYRVFSL